MRGSARDRERQREKGTGGRADSERK
jgi:hypothetical protein